jgi:Viral (Superfamily 1) RNA helicase
MRDLWKVIASDLAATLQRSKYDAASVWTGHVSFLREQFHSYQNSYEEVVSSTQQRGLAIDWLSKNQSALLDFMSDNNRMLIRGGPGSGKTVLAVEQASRLAAQGLKVGVICYNIGLSQYLVRTVGSLPRAQRPAFKGSFEALAALWGVTLPAAPDARAARDRFYRTEVPSLIQRRVETLTTDEKFDAWIVDEAQELHRGYWDVLKASLRDPKNGIIHAFGDKDQEIFRRHETDGDEADWHLRLPWVYAKGTLRKNLRNTRTIARLLESLSSRAAEPAGPFEGFPPEFVLVPDEVDIYEVADKFVRYLTSEYRWEPQQVLVINTGDKSARHRAQQGLDKIKYWNNFLKQKDVFHTHVSVVKGLERPVVVMVLDEFHAESKIDQQMYVGLSRALEDVIIVGKQKEFDQLGSFFDNFTPSPFAQWLA